MKYTLLILVIFTFVFSANAQSEKYIDVVNTSFNIFDFTSTFLTANTVNSLESAMSGSVSDNNQKDSIINRNSDYQATASLLINFKNISQKKIKSVSYLFEYTDGKKVFYKNKYTSKININPNENKKIRNRINLISPYLANAIGVEKITITKIVFADKTSIKF